MIMLYLHCLLLAGISDSSLTHQILVVAGPGGQQVGSAPVSSSCSRMHIE